MVVAQLLPNKWTLFSNSRNVYMLLSTKLKSIGFYMHYTFSHLSFPHSGFVGVTSFSYFVGFRSLIQRLEMVDPTGLIKEERIAFWINLHNVMIMHVIISISILHHYLYWNILVPGLTDLKMVSLKLSNHMLQFLILIICRHMLKKVFHTWTWRGLSQSVR
jgi:Protein of unknown function, DUF547